MVGSLLSGGLSPPMSWARAVPVTASSAAVASRAPPMNRWRITRIPLDGVDDRSAAGSPTRADRGPRRRRSAVPLLPHYALGRKVAADDTVGGTWVKGRFAQNAPLR